MDEKVLRANIRELIQRHNTNMAELSRAINKNHSFFFQYLTRKNPLTMRDKDRRATERHFNLPFGELGFDGVDEAPPTDSLSARFNNVKPDKRVHGGANYNFNKPRITQKTDLFPPNARKDLPVYSSAAAGEGFVIMSNDPVEWAERPTQLIGVEGAFAIYIDGDSMHPRYTHGELVYVRPRPPQKGKDAVIILSHDGEERRVLVKRFMGKEGDMLILEQYNPPQILRLPLDTIEHLYSITGGNWDP